MPKDNPPREKAQRKRFDETKRIPKLSRPRAAVNPENKTNKCWFYVTMDNIKNVVENVLSQGKDIRIITAESAYCSICHSDFSKANIDAPNGLLGHCRRVKKCLKEKERRNIVTLGLKMRKSSNTKGNPTFWDSVDSLRMMDEFPLKAYYLDRVMPELPPLELERESPFQPSTRANHPGTDESLAHYNQTSESEIFDFEDDESQQFDDYEDLDQEVAQASPEARGRATYVFLPIHHREQISGSASTRQQSVINTPMGTGERSPSITTGAEFSPYSSGAVERSLFMSPSYTQSCPSPFLVSGSGGSAPTAISVATASHPSRSPQVTYHAQAAAHLNTSSPAASTPVVTPVIERDIHMPEALIASTPARRGSNNPPLTMTHSLPLPFHVSPPLNPLPHAAVLSDISDGHGRSLFTGYRGSTGMTDPPVSSSQGDPYNGHLRTGSEGYTYRNFPFNITIGGCTPSSDTPPERQGQPDSGPSPYPSHSPSTFPFVSRIAMPSSRAPKSHPSVSSPFDGSQGHVAPRVQAMHSLHQSSSLYGGALERQLAGVMYHQSSPMHSHPTLEPGWEDSVGAMWMGAEEQRKNYPDGLYSDGIWITPSTTDLPGGFGLHALPMSNGNSTNTNVQRSSSAGPRTPSSLPGYSSSQIAAEDRLFSHNALGLHSAHSNIHPQELWSAAMHLSTGFNGASSTWPPSEGANHPRSSETTQSFGYHANHTSGSIAVPSSGDEVEVNGVACFEAPRSLTRTKGEAQTISRSQVVQMGANLDGVAFGASNGMRSRDTGNYELVHGAHTSSFQSNRKRSSSFDTRQGLVEPRQEHHVQRHVGDLAWAISPPNTGSIPTGRSSNENSRAAAATNLQVQGLMMNRGGLVQLGRRMQTGGL